MGVRSGMFQTGHLQLSTFRKEPDSSGPSEDSGTRMLKTSLRAPADDLRRPDPERNAASSTPPYLSHFNPTNMAFAEATTPAEEWEAGSRSSRAKVINRTQEVLVIQDSK